MKKKLEIFYNSPEGVKIAELILDGDVLKFCEELMQKGFNSKRQTDNIYVPAHSIVVVRYTDIKK
jgi:hypothetical protein